MELQIEETQLSNTLNYLHLLPEDEKFNLYLLVYLLNHAYLLNYKCKINKKDQYLH